MEGRCKEKKRADSKTGEMGRPGAGEIGDTNMEKERSAEAGKTARITSN